MLLLAALMLQAVPAAEPPAAEPDVNDIVVTGLRRLRLSTAIEDGKVRACEVRVTSGDSGIDRTACEATVACVQAGVTDGNLLADCVDQRVRTYVRKRKALG